MRAAQGNPAHPWRRGQLVLAIVLLAACSRGCMGKTPSTGHSVSNVQPSYALAGERAIFDAARLVLLGRASGLVTDAPLQAPVFVNKDDGASQQQLLKHWRHSQQKAPPAKAPPSKARTPQPLQLALPAVSKMEMMRRLAAKGLSTAGTSTELRRRLLMEALTDEELRLQCQLLGVAVAKTKAENRINLARRLALD